MYMLKNGRSACMNILNDAVNISLNLSLSRYLRETYCLRSLPNSYPISTFATLGEMVNFIRLL